MTRRIVDIQSEFANNNGFGTQTIWDLLSEDQGDILQEKIKNIIPDQKKGQNAIVEIRQTIFSNIWAQNKSNSSKCCMIFIDEVGRVYKNWAAYLSENELPKGSMVAPKNGVYTFNKLNEVNLEICPTPASSITHTVMQVADTATAVSGLVSAGVTIAAICTFPVSAPIMAAAGTVGLASAGYAAIRSGSNLVDRSLHDQSVALTDRQARGNWLGVLGGAIGLGASGATRALTTAAAAGSEVSMVTSMVVNGMNISSIVLSGSGLANGIFDMILKYNDDEDITVPDVLQLAASLVVFTHSVGNFRLASTMVNESRNGKIQSYRKSLSNRQRRMFDKMTKETIRIKGASQGKIDVIRSVNEIPSKQYLNDLHKINSKLNQENVRPSFGGAEKPVLLNNEVAVDTKVLRNSVQHNSGPKVLDQVTKPIPTTHESYVKSAQGLSVTNGNPVRPKNNIILQQVKPESETTGNLYKIITLSSGAIVKLAELGHSLIKNANSEKDFWDVAQQMAKEYCDKTFRFLMNLANTFVDNFMLDIKTKYGIPIPTEDVLKKMMTILENYAEIGFEYIQTKSLEIIIAMRVYFMSTPPSKVSPKVSSASYLAEPQLVFDNVVEKRTYTRASIVLANYTIPLKDFGATMFERIMHSDSFEDLILCMAKRFSEDEFRELMRLATWFIENELPDIEKIILIPIANEQVLYRIYKYCVNLDFSAGILDDTKYEILAILQSYFMSLNPNNRPELLQQCKDCSGYYAECKL